MGLSVFPMQLLGALIAVRLESIRPADTIILPAWRTSLVGSVLACGPDCTEVKIGDRVGFGAASGMESVLNGEAIRIMDEHKDVFAVFE